MVAPVSLILSLLCDPFRVFVSMPEVRLILTISSHKYLAYYKGVSDTVFTRAVDARTVKFPARVLRPFLTHDGIDGEFVIKFNTHHKFIGIRKLR